MPQPKRRVVRGQRRRGDAHVGPAAGFFAWAGQAGSRRGGGLSASSGGAASSRGVAASGSAGGSFATSPNSAAAAMSSAEPMTSFVPQAGQPTVRPERLSFAFSRLLQPWQVMEIYEGFFVLT